MVTSVRSVLNDDALFIIRVPLHPHVSVLCSDVRGSHLLVSVLLRVLRLGHDRSVVSDLLQSDVLGIPAAHHWHAGQRRVLRDPAGTTSALYEWTELRGTLHVTQISGPTRSPVAALEPSSSPEAGALTL